MILLEVSNRYWTIRELTVLSPVVAATFAGPFVTAAYAAAAVVTEIGLGWYDKLGTAADGGWTAQIVRLGGVVIGGVMAILASRYNSGRETKLANVTQVAEVAQQAILTDVPAVSRHGLRLAVRYESAAAEAMVGGDLYEVVESECGTRLLIGDTRGKGLDAVRLASRVLGCFRVIARGDRQLAEIVPYLDAEVASVGGLDDFVTAVVAEFDGSQLTLANAGHPDPVLWRRGRAWLLGPPERQPPLGLGAGPGPGVGVGAGAGAGAKAGAGAETGADVSDGDSRLATMPLEPGDRLLFYTDGIAEAREQRTRAFFPLLTVTAHVLGRAPTIEEALADLVLAVRDWTGSALSDDVALLAAEVPAAPATPGAHGPAALAAHRQEDQAEPRARPRVTSAAGIGDPAPVARAPSVRAPRRWRVDLEPTGRGRRQDRRSNAEGSDDAGKRGRR